jgi:hypothetical protein
MQRDFEHWLTAKKLENTASQSRSSSAMRQNYDVNVYKNETESVRSRPASARLDAALPAMRSASLMPRSESRAKEIMKQTGIVDKSLEEDLLAFYRAKQSMTKRS